MNKAYSNQGWDCLVIASRSKYSILVQQVCACGVESLGSWSLGLGDDQLGNMWYTILGWQGCTHCVAQRGLAKQKMTTQK